MRAVDSAQPRDPTVFVLEFIDQINRHDLEGSAFLLTANPLLAEGGEQQAEGKTEVLRYWRDLFSRSPDYHIEVLDLEGLGDSVFVVGYACGMTEAGDLTRVPTTWFARLKNRLISEWRIYTEKEAGA